MKNLNLLTILLLGFSLSFTACKKDDEPAPTTTTTQVTDDKKDDKPAPTREELLANDWKITAVFLDEPIVFDSFEIFDLYDFMEECQKDDIYQFNIDGTGSNIMNQVCEDEEDSDFLWYFNPEDKNEIWIDAEGVTEIYTIVEITEKQMILDQLGDIAGEETLVHIRFER